MSSHQDPPRGGVVVSPMFNDWDAAHHLLTDLDRAAERCAGSVSVVLVNDGSTDAGGFAPEFLAGLHGLASVEILDLVTNVGHAHALAVGLAYVAREKSGEWVVVMDCDGEDQPEDVPRLLEALQEAPDRVVVAARERRSESLTFRVYYQLYKLLFRLLTGRTIAFGNFCAIPWSVLEKLVFVPDLFNHLAATLVKSRFAIARLPTARGKRYAGHSKMNFVSLIQLGLGAIAVDLERVLVRILLMLAVFISVLVVAMAVVAGIRFTTDLAIPGWASNVFAALTILLVQSSVVAVLLLFIDLKNRTVSLMVPALRYRDFLAETARVTA